MGITNTHKKREENSTPFPWVPMMAISLALLSHSFAISSLFPYVGYMVQDLGMAKTKDEAGYYAGYIASAFMVGRVSSSYYWGSFSDTHGRKPGLYAALISLAVFSVAFGLSRDFFWAVACRYGQKTLELVSPNDSVIIIPSMVSPCLSCKFLTLVALQTPIVLSQ
ncbi:unnamed protein product [Discosporangium mesarthrocarpum]